MNAQSLLTTYPFVTHLSTTLAICCLPFLILRAFRAGTAAVDSTYELRLRWLLILTAIFTLEPMAALDLTATLHPHVFDAYALRFDAAAGLGFTPLLVEWIDAIPTLPQLISNAYGLTPLGFLAVALLQLSGRSRHVPTAMLVWVVMTSLALIAYNAFPVVGPRYVFGYPGFLEALRNPESVPLALALVPPFPRNGVPSMHFGWMLAASILWWQSGTRPLSRALMIGTTICTLLATLYMGEHYVVDLVVAVPFVLGSIALCSSSIAWQSKLRQRLVVSGFGAWFLWVILLRTQIELLVEQPWLAKGLVLSSFGLIALQWRMLLRLKDEPHAQDVEAMAPAKNDRDVTNRVGMMFFASGFAALIYQVLFAKELALVFGSTATATFTVLATFLGGMAIGSYAGGILANRTSRPLVIYAFVEAGIAIYCLITPTLFEGVQNTYVFLASGMPPDTRFLLVLRIALGASVLLVPTVLMGATLPLLAGQLSKGRQSMGERVAWLYFANTAGAAAGALLSAYFVIPAIGIKSSTLIAAMLNLLVALAALELAKKMIMQSDAGSGFLAEEIQRVSAVPPKHLMSAMLSLGAVGILSLGLEVVYVHMLSIVAGNSVYAFGLMVATFLLGLSLGGGVGRWLLLSGRYTSISLLPHAVLGLACSVAMTSVFWNAIPEYFASYANYPVARTFAAREAIRGIVCVLIMIPPTLFIGLAYTLAMDTVTASNARPKTVLLGIGGAVNTLGNILGVLLFGFMLLPMLGGHGANLTIAAASIGLAVCLFVITRANRFLKWSQVVLVAILVTTAAGRTQLDYDKLSSGANVYFSPQEWGKVIDHTESIDGGLTTVALRETGDYNLLTLLTNGKFQGNNAIQGEMQAQVGFALAPLIHTERREHALVIGYGTGVTGRVFYEAGFEHIDIVELSADVIAMADKHFADVNHGVSRAPAVRMHVTDGRNYLLLTDKKYDVISIEISSIWFAGAASLYNREFFRLVKQRMMQDGVLQQWMQLHHLSPLDILTIIATLRSEFEFVNLYLIGNQGILVATNDPNRSLPSDAAIKTLEARRELNAVRYILGSDFGAVKQSLLLGTDGVDAYLGRLAVPPEWLASTDNNLRLEYSTPKGNVNDAIGSYQANIDILSEFRSR